MELKTKQLASTTESNVSKEEKHDIFSLINNTLQSEGYDQCNDLKEYLSFCESVEDKLYGHVTQLISDLSAITGIRFINASKEDIKEYLCLSNIMIDTYRLRKSYNEKLNLIQHVNRSIESKVTSLIDAIPQGFKLVEHRFRNGNIVKEYYITYFNNLSLLRHRDSSYTFDFLSAIDGSAVKVEVFDYSFVDAHDWPKRIPDRTSAMIEVMKNSPINYQYQILEGVGTETSIREYNREDQVKTEINKYDPALVISLGDEQFVIDYWDENYLVRTEESCHHPYQNNMTMSRIKTINCKTMF